MSGFSLGSPLGLPTSLASACAVSHDPSNGRGAAARRGTPALALLVSGGVHAAALLLFLIASARSGRELDSSIPVHGYLIPTIDLLRLEAPPAMAAPRTTGAKRSEGVVEPVDPRKSVKAALDKLLEGIVPETSGMPGGPASTTGSIGGSQAGPGYAPPADTGDPNAPSLYDEAPVPVVAPEPIYPDIAREAGIEGRVVVDALVSREGRVLNVNVRGGDATLADAAAKAVRLWKFRPARRNGKPVAAWVSVPVRFTLR